MDQRIDGPGGRTLASDRPVLYKCPYCVRGRFCDPGDWEAAKQHIKTVHQRETGNGIRRRDRRFGDLQLGRGQKGPKVREGLFDAEP
jgi:hypothetical protein